MFQYSSLNSVQEGIKEGSLQLINIVESYLNRIAEKKHLNAFIEVYPEEAKSRAIQIQDKIINGTAGKLAGMVLGIKDLICYKDHNISAGSKILENYNSIFSSTVVERILAEDAIIIGRQNCDEFAMGGSNENSYFGPVKNDADNTKVPNKMRRFTSSPKPSDLDFL